jgi:hypothetical protein
MEQAVEWFFLITSLVVGLSHVLYPGDWGAAFAAMHRAGRPGAFANGGLSLATGAAIVAGHPVWSGPAVVLTVLGCLMIVKGVSCFLSPDRALASMSYGSSGRGFRAAGGLLLVFCAWVGYCLWVAGGRL